mmetsp:Transcript_44091/g.84268  ORF Transcript_44091/g.84268 Transcript_44091/m.84268 type:complete len:250 (-) Transcript_44091:908-1657(-)
MSQTCCSESHFYSTSLGALFICRNTMPVHCKRRSARRFFTRHVAGERETRCMPRFHSFSIVGRYNLFHLPYRRCGRRFLCGFNSSACNATCSGVQTLPLFQISSRQTHVNAHFARSVSFPFRGCLKRRFHARQRARELVRANARGWHSPTATPNCLASPQHFQSCTVCKDRLASFHNGSIQRLLHSRGRRPRVSRHHHRTQQNRCHPSRQQRALQPKKDPPTDLVCAGQGQSSSRRRQVAAAGLAAGTS